LRVHWPNHVSLVQLYAIWNAEFFMQIFTHAHRANGICIAPEQQDWARYFVVMNHLNGFDDRQTNWAPQMFAGNRLANRQPERA
jgi:hypothetical protein